MTLINLFFVFLYIGAFTIGGGLVAITLMQQELVDKGIISQELFLNMVAVSESTPGPIGINMATYVGYNFYGVIGGVVTTFATVLPSFIVILIIAKYFYKFQDKPLVKSAFYGLRAGTTGMIAVATWNVLSVNLIHVSAFIQTKNFFDLIHIPSFIFFLFIFILYNKKNWHPLLYILFGVIFGIVFL